MKTKFETNVASEIPRTKMSQEPSLPWKVSAEDLAGAPSAGEEYKIAASSSPLKARGIFIVMLLVAAFIATVYFVSLIIKDNTRARENMQKTEMAVSTLRTDIEKMNSEKMALSENMGQLEKKVRDLNAQKELYTTVIESLAKKSDEPVSDKETGPSSAMPDSRVSQ